MRRRRVWLGLGLGICLASGGAAWAQEDGGVTPTDGGGMGVPESLYVPNFAHAPFTLRLHTEWVQNLRSGGSFTEVNERRLR